MGDWDAPPIEAPAAAKAIWEAAYAEPPDAGDTAGHAPASEKSELWGPDGQQSSEPEAEAAAEAGAVSTQGLEQASGMEHGEEELEKPAEDPAGKAANPNEPAPYPWRQAQYQRCSPAKRRRLSTLDHGVLISWHRHFGSGGTFESDAFPARSRMAPFFHLLFKNKPQVSRASRPLRARGSWSTAPTPTLSRGWVTASRASSTAGLRTTNCKHSRSFPTTTLPLSPPPLKPVWWERFF